MSLFNVYPLNPIAITKANGSRVWDDKGQEYLDMYGGHAVISIGHTHPHWVKRIEDQLHQIAFYSNSVIMPIQEELAKAINEISGKKDFQLFLCNSGAEANENALKLASFHTGRKKIIAFKKAFHGRTSLAVAATDNPSIIAPVNETDNIIFLPFNDIDALDACFKQNENTIAAVIIEGIQGVAGIHEASNTFLQAIRKNCDQFGAVYIADSVQCGYGRSGKFFAHDFAGVHADIYSMAKGMGNGFPVGAILIAPHIQAKFGMLGTTFGGNPLACAAALGVIEVMQKDHLIQNAKEQGDYLINALRNVQGVKTVRGKGLMIGFEMEEGLEDVRKVLLNDCKIFTGEAKPNVIRLLPSLAITKTDIDLFLKGLQQAIALLHQ
ncbi:MAG: aspartate aminotransferase family protein [Chitinophagaceae bacterium]|jgi:acetylornithine aminotransferase|nr:aminotransferase class III-fold pyridoxal phosphate-dependent enzyme [Sediminibacterium sp.]